jgi:hypothetical protein
MKKNLYLSFGIILMTLLTVSTAFAVTKTTSQSGNWSSTTTWGGNPAPVAGDDVIINGGFTVTVDIPNAACLTLQLGGSVLGTGTGTLTFTSGSVLTVSGIVNMGPVNNNGTAGSLVMTSGGTLQCDGITLGRLGNWNAGTGTIEFTATNSIPNNTNVNFNNLTMSGGTTSFPRNITATGNVVINTGATLDGGTNILTVLGNWVNNGTFTGNAGTVTFAKNGNQTISGTGVNNFNLMRADLGTSISNTLEVVSSHFNAPDAFLTLINGTFKMSGTFTFANTFIVGPLYNIDPTAGFWVNNPNVTVTAQAGGSVSVRGLLRLSAGTYNIGDSPDNSLNYVTGSTIIIEGGTLNIAGRLTRNNATQTIVYTQSGGIVTVVTQGSTDVTLAGFDLGAVGSTFTMSGGTIVIRNATSAPADFLNASSVANVTGGTLQVGDASSSNAQIIRIQSPRSIANLVISNATSQAVKPTAQLVTSGLNIPGSVTIQSGTSFNANGLNLSLGGDWTNNGTFSSGGGNTTTFNGSGLQTISNPSGETFNNLIINKPGSILSLGNALTVSNSFNIIQGTIAIGGNTLTLNGSVAGAGNFTSTSAGTVAYNQGSAGQNVLPGNYGNLVFSNFNKTLASSGTTGVSALFTPGSAGGHTVTGSTVDFNGGAQQVPSFTYNNLTLSGSGTKTGSGTITVNGSMTNNPGISFTGTTLLNLNGPTHANNGILNAATLSAGAGAILTNSGTVTTTTALAGAGTLTQGPSGILNIAGSTGIAALDAAAAGNTVNYTGASQTLVPATYHHLSLSGSGIPVLTGVNTINGNLTLSGTVSITADGGMTVGGNLTIGSGTSFDAATFSHSAKGNWSNAGTFNAGSSTITLDGTVPQTISGSVFNNLTVSNTAGVSMLTDAVVNGTLSLTSGAFFIGPYSLNLNDGISVVAGTLIGGTTSNMLIAGSGAATSLPAVALNNLTLNRASGLTLSGAVSVNGNLTILNGQLATGVNAITLGPLGTITEIPGQPVIGNISTTRNISATGGTETFGNIGADVTLNGVALGSTTVSRKTGTASAGNGYSSILRYFDIVPATNASLNATLVFHYDASEVNGQNPDAFELYRSQDNGVTWSDLGGTVNSAIKTVSLSGIGSFSRWTVSDTSNRIGNYPVPVIANISPASKNAGDPGFTLTVNGSEFYNGKSVVRFNGSARATTFISPTQITAAIPAGDLLVAGAFPVTVFNGGGGGASNAQNFTVIPVIPVKVRVETAANGSGTVVPAQLLASGTSITVYAIARDALDNFVSNVASSWTLENLTGGVAAGDLVPSVDSKSAVFSGHVAGTADIRAASGGLTEFPSGTVTVMPGTAAGIRVETAANGSGIVVPAQSLASGASISLFAVTRDASNNFIANVSASGWAIENTTGGIVSGDLVPSVDNKSAVFTGHVTGTANITANSGVLTSTPSGLITVIPGPATSILVETAANGSGVVVPSQSLASGTSLTVFAITRDASGNFIANAVPASWVLENITGGVLAGDLVPAVDAKSAIFTAHGAGTSDIKATLGTLTSTPSGTITITTGAAAKVGVETAANGSGTIVPAQSLPSGSSLTVYAIARDASNNFVANVAATAWTLQNISGGVIAGDLAPAVDGKSAVLTGHVTGNAAIRATSGILTATQSGLISVIAGPAAKIRVETNAAGTGVVVPAQSLVPGASITVFAIARDASNNFVANVVGSPWTLENITGGVVQGNLVPGVTGKSATFTGNIIGSANIKAISGALVTTSSGLITVITGAPVTVRVETAPNASGVVVPAQLVASGASVTVYANTRDAANNFVTNVASAWVMENLTSGVAAGDLVPSVDGKSAVFTGHVVGTGNIRATSGTLVSTPSGALAVIPGPAAKVRVESAANGSGVVIPALSLSSGSSITVFSISRDASNNFISNVAVSAWTTENVTGGVVAGDLVPSVDTKSATFTAHVTGSASIKATSGVLTPTTSGIITVIPGAATKIIVETAADGSGAAVPAQSVVSGAPLTVYAVSRDGSNNMVSNVAASSWTLENITGGVVAGDLVPAVDGKSAVFTGHVIGSGNIRATSGALTATASGTITVSVSALLSLQGNVIGTGQSNCFNATQTITVAGGSTTFLVQNGGSATMIAGQNIIFLPGTTVEPGGYLHGYITTANQYCVPVLAPAVTSTTGSDESPLMPVNISSFRVYPNPTTGAFTLDLAGDEKTGAARVDIFGMTGNLVLRTEFPAFGKHAMSLAGTAPGLYFIRITTGDRTETLRIIRQ